MVFRRNFPCIKTHTLRETRTPPRLFLNSKPTKDRATILRCRQFNLADHPLQPQFRQENPQLACFGAMVRSTSCYAETQVSRMSTTPELTTHQRLQSTIKAFFDKASLIPPQSRSCPECGREMQFLKSIFSLSGTDLAWQILLPVCACELGNLSKGPSLTH